MLLILVILFFSFSCQPSRKHGFLCCSIPRAQAQQATFLCPLNGQTPVLGSTGNNIFCSAAGTTSTCPINSICLVARNSESSLICCQSAATVLPICPNNGIPQPSTTGYIPCALGSNTCNIGYTCVTSANDISIQMCCTSSTSTVPACPQQQQPYLQAGNPIYCTISQPNSCPTGYSCQQAVGTSNYICCTIPSPLTCPTQFSPSIDVSGNTIICSPSAPAGCPAGASCLPANNFPSTYLCCATVTSQRICPGNQQALLTSSNSPVFCSQPATSCSESGYTCQLSPILASYVCCGVPSQTAVCADGRETFTQTSGSAYTCNPNSFPSGCPIQYDCALSTQSSIFVCCKQNSLPTPSPVQQCPNAWAAYMDSLTGQYRTCYGPMDTSCPLGYSCTPSSVPGQFLCCRLASSPTCPQGRTFLVNSQPRLCSVTLPNQCPRGYLCQQSTNPTVTICCSSSLRDESIICPDHSLPLMIGSTPQKCPIENSPSTCPLNYLCKRSNNGILICCRDRTVPLRLSPSHPMAQCPNGVRAGRSSVQCRTQSDCPENAECVRSINMPNYSLCCPTAVPPDTRCRSRRTQLLDGQPVACYPGRLCDHDFECSQETSNNHFVCCEPTASTKEECPEQRVPYIVARTEEYIHCDQTAFTCPDDYECQISLLSTRFICCSKLPKCPGYHNGIPKRCKSERECLHGTICVPSTVPGVQVCCSSALLDILEK